MSTTVWRLNDLAILKSAGVAIDAEIIEGLSPRIAEVKRNGQMITPPQFDTQQEALDWAWQNIRMIDDEFVRVYTPVVCS